VRLTGRAKVPKPPVGEINADSNECKNEQESPCPRHIGNRTVEVMAEYIAQAAIGTCIESRANSIKGEKADSAGARRSCERRGYRVQPGHELRDQQKG
jgi:hypothetical protein